VLSRDLAAAGQYPPVALLDSLSRLMPAVTTREHREQAARVRRLLATFTRSEDLIRIGAYKPGFDVELDRAIAVMPSLRAFMEQQSGEPVTLEASIAMLREMAL
jgi:flagellum-specific ATP synthase